MAGAQSLMWEKTHIGDDAHIRTREGDNQHTEHNTVIGKCDCSPDTCWHGTLGNGYNLSH